MNECCSSSDSRSSCCAGIDLGLLLLRIGLGAIFIVHGYPKMFGGPEVWKNLGGAMGLWGIHFSPVFWGCMAALSEFFGGIFLVFGLGTRLFAVLLTITMAVAATMHFSMQPGFAAAAHPLSLAVVFLSLVFTGAGRFSLDTLIRSNSRE